MSLPDALRDALGQILADQRREWRRDAELIEARNRAEKAEMRALYDARLEEFCAEMRATVDAQVAARLAEVRNGEDGAPGKDGADAAPVDDVQIDDAVARYFAANPPPSGIDGKDGRDGAPGKDGADAAPVTDDRIAEAVARHLVANPPPAGDPGAPGERGPEGPAGKMPVVRAWADTVHYEGAIVAHAGAMWQAQRDTGREPPHDDWTCLAQAGRDGADGRSFALRGTWIEAEAYRHLDVVMLNGASFGALRDDPGPCPGDGWQLFAAQGKRGHPGDRGGPGPAGDRGPPGPALRSADVDGDGVVTLTNADGSAATLDLYPLLNRIAR